MIEIRSPLFASLPDAALARLRDAVLPRVFAPGEAMVNEGETLEELFIVVRGDALVVGRDWHGQKHTLARLGPGECFGELSMLSGEPASATVEALTETEVWVLPHAAAIAIADEFPALARNFSALLADRLRLSNERTLRARRGQLVALLALDRAPWTLRLACRLAYSVANHTRQAAALVDTSGRIGAFGDLHVAVRSMEEALGERAVLDAAGEPLDYLRLIAFERDGNGASPSQLVAALERLQARSRNVLVYVDEGTSTAEGVLRHADHVLAIAREGDLPLLNARLAACATSDDAKRSVVLLSDRPDAPKAGDRRQAQRATNGWQVQAIVPGGLASLEREQEADSPSGQAIDRLARAMAGLSVGLALGAGGAKGYAHIGVLRALQRARVPVDCVAGCSIGAPLAAGLAAGWSPEQIRASLDAVSAKAVRPNMPFVSILTSRAIRNELRNVSGETRFEELMMPLGIVAVDIVAGREVLLRRGRIWPALLASMAYPGIYEPVRMGARYLVDGGVLNPVPVSAAVELGADIVISSVLSGSLEYAAPSQPSDPNRRRLILESISRTLEIMQGKIVQESCTRADVAIQPVFKNPPGLLDFRKGRELEGAGEEAAEQALPRLRVVLPWLA